MDTVPIWPGQRRCGLRPTSVRFHRSPAAIAVSCPRRLRDGSLAQSRPLRGEPLRSAVVGGVIGAAFMIMSRCNPSIIGSLPASGCYVWGAIVVCPRCNVGRLTGQRRCRMRREAAADTCGQPPARLDWRCEGRQRAVDSSRSSRPPVLVARQPSPARRVIMLTSIAPFPVATGAGARRFRSLRIENMLRARPADGGTPRRNKPVMSFLVGQMLRSR
jgi:hypothetical protein